MTSDESLIDRMRCGDFQAWGEFALRFRPILEAYARRVRIPPWEWPACVSDVLDDEALRLSNSSSPPPVNLSAYLIRAVFNRYLRLRRTEASRDRLLDRAADDRSGELVVSSSCSSHALRSSAGPDAPITDASVALSRLARELRAGLTDEEETILIWVSEGVHHRQIAKWLGVSYDACTKRIWRLCRRLRSRAADYAVQYSVLERSEITRFIRRADSGAASAESLRVRTVATSTTPEGTARERRRESQRARAEGA